MFDSITGWKLSVEKFDSGGAYIVAPPEQLARLARVLARNRVPWLVDGWVPSLRRGGPPAEPVIRLGPAVNPETVQRILDGEA